MGDTLFDLGRFEPMYGTCRHLVGDRCRNCRPRRAQYTPAPAFLTTLTLVDANVDTAVLRLEIEVGTPSWSEIVNTTEQLLEILDWNLPEPVVL